MWRLRRPSVFLLLLACLGCFRATLADDCYLVAPNVFRLGSKETVAVAVEGGADQQVRVSLQNLPNQRGVFFTETRRVSPRRPEIWDVGVELADLPNLTLGKAPVYVTLEVKCGSLWTRSAQVLVSPKSGEHYFLQTDKPIYHPGSAVKIRFIAMDETLRPSNKKFKVEIQNPQNVTVEARDFEPTTGPMLTHVVTLPEHTLLGEWKVVVKYGYKFEQNETVTFEVKEYVLPRFSVELSTVNYVPDNFTHVQCFVQARFLNTQPVQGVVQYRFGLKSEAGSEQWIGTGKEPKLLNDGRAHFRVDRDSIARRLGAPLESLFRGRYRLVIEATVTEEATAAKQTARNEKAVFSTTPFVISTSKSQKSFKPGVKTYVIAQVTYLNGDAARGIEMQLTNTGPKNLSTKATTDNDGIATFPISTVINDGSLNLKVETIDKDFRQSEQAQVEFQLLKYEHTARGFIAIEKRDPKKKSTPGEIYEAVLFTNSPNKVSSVYYVVLSRGRILEAEVLEEGQIIERGLKFTVTPEMTPSFRIVTFARIDGHIVSDSIYVSAEPTCSVASQFNVTLAKSYNQQAEPGSSQTLVITGTPGTQVGILGVDQAVYLLRRKDLLTREKLFQQLDAKDLGCGAGGGTDSVQALYDAGVLLLANTDDASPKRNDLSCQPRHRQKREAPLSVEDTYKDPVERECCSRGLKRDKFLRSCSERVDVLREFRDHDESLITEECIEAFATCCERNEELEASARSGDKDGDSLDDGEFEFDGTVRHDFRETSLFNQYTIRENRRVEVEHTLPHSITTWEVNAVSTAPSGGICASEPLKIVTFKSVFVEINVPYSVRKNEQVEIPATVYNYGQKDIKAKVALLGTQDICSGTREGERSAIQRIDVPSGHGRTIIFPVIPLATGERYIQVTVVSSAGSDSARVKLRIEHNGAPKNESFNVPLNPTDAKKRQQRSISHEHYTESYVTNGRQLVQIQRPSPDNAIPGSEHCEIGITGDKLGPALETMVKNPGSIMSMPTGCGEQTMIKLAPTLYAYQYLRAVGRISGPDEDKALGFIREGYKKILTYRKTDGSFSVWTNYPSSLWLTAFVLRNLCEARKSTMIDEAVITSGLRYMMTQQQHDGSFKDAYHLHHKELLGGVDGPVPLSAYVLLTLQECIKDGVRVEDLGVSTARATNFVENNLESGSPPYTLALGAYALALSDSPNKLTALEWLRNVAVHDQVAGTRHVPSTTLPLTIQGTAYALMAFLSERESRDYVDGYVRWLNDKMQPTGALSSTQDTVVALQALAKYATVSKDDNIDLTCQVTLNKPKEFKEIVRIKRDNAHQLTRIPIPSDGDKIFVDVTGSGSAHMYFLYKYHVPVEREDICKFLIAVNFEEKKPNITFLTRFARDANNQRRKFSKLSSTYKIKVCARYLEGNATGMAILDVGLLTGFKPIIEDLKKLVTDGTVQFYELTRRSVAFYVESIPTNADVCLEFGLEKEFAIGQIQSSYVKVYSYYDPDMSCTEFYAPDNSSPLLKLHCDDTDVCACAEGGCPPEKPLARFLEESEDDTERRESLREFVCDKVDYVWLGTPQDKYTRDGFKYVVFRIKQVLKPGREAEEDLHGKTRHIKARERCASFNLELKKDYVVMGLDSEYLEHVEHGPDQPLYIMDAAAMVLPKSTRKKPTRDLTTWFIKEFSNEESRCFT